MILDEKLRWAGFWILDGLRGGQTRKYYDRIRYAWKEGSSVAETEERIRNLIRHAVKTTDFYKDYPEDTPLEKLPVVNKDRYTTSHDPEQRQNLSQYCRWYFSRGGSRILYWNERSIYSCVGK